MTSFIAEGDYAVDFLRWPERKTEELTLLEHKLRLVKDQLAGVCTIHIPA